MSRHTVTFLPGGVAVATEPGRTVLETAAAAGVGINSTCGGQGTCGKCKVTVLGEDREVLACQLLVERDLTVEIPPESQVRDSRILTKLSVGAALTVGEAPLAQRVAVELAPPGAARHEADAERLLRALRQRFGGAFQDYALDLAALRALPAVGRSQDWHFDAILADVTGVGRVIAVEPSASAAYGLAIDLGTTTIVAALLELDTGRVVGSHAQLNGQAPFGADVISRIIYAQEDEHGLAELRETARDTIAHCVATVLREHDLEPDDALAAVIVGNTVMTHLLLGVDPANIRREPYVPALCSLPTLRAADVGLAIRPGAPVYLAPCVSSYVGGDITAGALAAAVTDSPQLTLFIDLGTNGEAVVARDEWAVCCSCSAGPAFEGSGLDYGMYAASGAIERVAYDSATDAVDYGVIGDEAPRGICGSGYVDALAELLRTGVIDRSGRIDLSFASPRVRVRNDLPEFVLVWGSEAGREEDISVGQDDIQTLIRSKAAVYSGVATLLDSLNLRAMEIERLLIAGGFGNYLHPDHAVAIGLLPDLPRERIHFLGNTALTGAGMALLAREARQRTGAIAVRMTNFELSTVPSYMERYVSGLFLPHTDLSLFPSATQG